MPSGYRKDGSKLGFQTGLNWKGKTNLWNKGLTKETDERVRRNAQSTSLVRKKLFKEGKLKAWNKGLTKETSEGVLKYSLKNKGKKMSIESRQKMRLAKLGTKLSEVTKHKMSVARKGQKRSIESRKNISEGAKKRFSNPKNRQKLSDDNVRTWKIKEVRERRINGIIRAMSQRKRPTCYEKTIIGICEEYGIPLRYVGDGKLIINGGNPDFVDQDSKKVVEVYYDYFKIRDFGSIENYEIIRRKKFAKKDVQTMFLKNKDFKKGKNHLRNELESFIQERGS